MWEYIILLTKPKLNRFWTFKDYFHLSLKIILSSFSPQSFKYIYLELDFNASFQFFFQSILNHKLEFL